jgi:hypothetical protein
MGLPVNAVSVAKVEKIKRNVVKRISGGEQKTLSIRMGGMNLTKKNVLNVAKGTRLGIVEIYWITT